MHKLKVQAGSMKLKSEVITQFFFQQLATKEIDIYIYIY